MNIDLLNLLTSILGEPTVTKNNTEAVFFSPFISHAKKKLSINVNPKHSNYCRWQCWVSGNGGYNIYQLFKKIKANREHYKKLKEIVQPPKSWSSIKGNETVENENKNKIQLPIEFKPLYKRDDSYKRNIALNYLKKRNLTPYDIFRYDIGYCEEGEYENRIIIPSYDRNYELNYFIARSFTGHELKYKNPPISKDIVAFESFINYNEPIILCEGFFDAIFIKNNCIPLMGTSLLSSVKKSLIKNSVKCVYLVFDNDDNKSVNKKIKEKIVKISEELISSDISVKITNLPNGKDPAVLGTIETQKYMRQSNDVNFSSLMNMRLQNI